MQSSCPRAWPPSTDFEHCFRALPPSTVLVITSALGAQQGTSRTDNVAGFPSSPWDVAILPVLKPVDRTPILENSPRPPMEATKKAEPRQPEVLSLENVLKRVPLLRRIVKDAVECFEGRRKAKEFFEELTIISRKFSSSEIYETLSSLRRDVSEADRALEAFEKEVKDLGGILKDPGRGLAYFYSQRDERKIFLIWELRDPDLLCWHELDETFPDRLPIDMSGAARSDLGFNYHGRD